MAPGGEHEDATVEPALAGGVADFESANAGQHDVENEQVKGLLGREA